MHRATPANSSFRAYSAGGARSTISSIDDTKLMKEMGGNFMKGESRTKIESPQNYGWSSVTFDPDEEQQQGGSQGGGGGGQGGGQQQKGGGPETFISFMGGNRSFPVAGPIDDRRHRLKGLDKGDVAMFRGKDDSQQFHLTSDGGFWSAAEGKTCRMQLVAKQQQQQSQGGGQGASGAATFAAAGGGAGGGQSGGGQQQSEKGQKPVYKDGKENSYRYVDITDDYTNASGKNVHLKLGDKKTYVDVNEDKNVYLGGKKGEGSFAKVMTESGPSANVYAKIG